jgi:long-chain acyl-CoA synthetase
MDPFFSGCRAQRISKVDKIERISEETLSSLTQYTFPQTLSRQADHLGPERVAIREKAYGVWKTIGWKEYFSYVRKVGLGLLALGLKRGENVGLILDNHPEWLFSELGAQAVGAVTVPLFTSAVAREQAKGLSRVDAAFVFVQDQEARHLHRPHGHAHLSGRSLAHQLCGSPQTG